MLIIIEFANIRLKRASNDHHSQTSEREKPVVLGETPRMKVQGASKSIAVSKPCSLIIIYQRLPLFNNFFEKTIPVWLVINLGDTQKRLYRNRRCFYTQNSQNNQPYTQDYPSYFKEKKL